MIFFKPTEAKDLTHEELIEKIMMRAIIAAFVLGAAAGYTGGHDDAAKQYTVQKNRQRKAPGI